VALFGAHRTDGWHHLGTGLTGANRGVAPTWRHPEPERGPVLVFPVDPAGDKPTGGTILARWHADSASRIEGGTKRPLPRRLGGGTVWDARRLRRGPKDRPIRRARSEGWPHLGTSWCRVDGWHHPDGTANRRVALVWASRSTPQETNRRVAPSWRPRELTGGTILGWHDLGVPVDPAGDELTGGTILGRAGDELTGGTILGRSKPGAPPACLSRKHRLQCPAMPVFTPSVRLSR
jgi:hypothetical protein